MEPRVPAIAGAAIVVAVAEVHQRQPITREALSGRVELHFVNRRVDRMRFGRSVEPGQALTVEAREHSVFVGRPRKSVHADHFAADHDEIAHGKIAP